MKKVLTTISTTILLLVLMLTVLTGCAPKLADVNISSENLAEKAVFKNDKGEQIKSFQIKNSSSTKGYVDVIFENEVKINTIVLREKGYNVSDFEIYNIKDGAEELLYKQDSIDKMRYCTFDEITTKQLRIKVLASEGKSYNVNGIEIYNAPKKQDKNFRVTTYLHINRFLCLDDSDTSENIDRLERLEEYDKIYGINAFEKITDVILFDTATLNENGTMNIHSKLKLAVENLREIEKRLNKKFTVYACILNGNYQGDPSNWNNDMNLKSAHYAKSMGDNRQELLKNINEMVKTYGLDGVAFDWEYILKNKYWNLYADFLIELNKSMPQEKKISIALSSWSNKLPKRAFDAIDCVEVMSYDLFDERRNHSNFYDCTYKDVLEFIKRGFPIEKLNLGLPFYARETEGGEAFWFEYKQEAEKLGYFGNYTDEIEYNPGQFYKYRHYYNGAQMIKDKTVWAMDTGLGGVMVWNHTCDTHYDLKDKNTGKSLSLFKAISDGIDLRK